MGQKRTTRDVIAVSIEKETAAADVNICSPKKVFTNSAGVKEHEVIASISQLPAGSMGKVSFPPMC